MVYSKRNVANNPADFPPPPMWMSWVAGLDYERDPSLPHGFRYASKDTGSLRVHATLEAAKKELMWIGRNSKYRGDQAGKFIVDWSLYEWVEGQWVLRHSGQAGERRNDNELFKRPPTKKEQRALASILRVMEKRGV